VLRAARIVVIDNEVELLESSNRDRLLKESDCTHAQHLPYLVDSIGKPHAHYGPGRPLLGIARLDIFLRELRQVTVASGVDNSFATGDRPPARQSECRFRRAVAQLRSIEGPVQAHTNQRSRYRKNP
jgi:hypothetical protein